jgi:hypothetical protein
MTPGPPPTPQPPYRGLLRFMDGAPTWQEALGMGGLFVGVVGLLLIARWSFRDFWRGQVHGLSDSSGRVLAAGVGCVVAAGGLFWWLWVLLEGIAARMGVTALALVFLIADEFRSGGRRRRR